MPRIFISIMILILSTHGIASKNPIYHECPPVSMIKTEVIDKDVCKTFIKACDLKHTATLISSKGEPIKVSNHSTDAVQLSGNPAKSSNVEFHGGKNGNGVLFCYYHTGNTQFILSSKLRQFDPKKCVLENGKRACTGHMGECRLVCSES